MTETPESETLSETISRKAEEWTQEDLETIVAGLLTQREKWDLEQSKGSRKLTKSTSIPGAKKKPVSKVARGLKGIQL